MRTSDQLDQLGAALALAQAQIEGARKSAQNPHLRNRYADLAACWDACREPLTQHGLSVVQGAATGDGVVTVTTRLLHSSGQWMESELTLPWGSSKGTTDAQAIGSAITYARRYTLSAMVGIAPDDDDGASAGARQRQPAPKPAPRPTALPPTDEPADRMQEMWERIVAREAAVGPEVTAAVRAECGITGDGSTATEAQLRAYGLALRARQEGA